jgi:hypothetical protein
MAPRTGDKVDRPDPAMAPLGTDDEAAGTPPSRDRAKPLQISSSSLRLRCCSSGSACGVVRGVDTWLREEMANPVGGNSVAIGPGGSVDPKITR